MNSGDLTPGFGVGNTPDPHLPDESVQSLSQISNPLSNQPEQLFQALFAAAIDAMLIVDDAYQVIAVNPAACRLYNRPQAVLIGRNGADFIEPAFDTYDNWQQLLQTQAIAGETRIVCPDYTVRTVEYTLTANFVPQRHLIVMREVTDSGSTPTERRQLEVGLQISDRRLREILNHAIAVVGSLRAFANRNWECEYYSSGCEVIFGYTAQELISDNQLWLSRILEDDIRTVILPAFELVFAEATGTIDYRFRHKDNTIRWISSTYTSTRDEAGDCWIVTVVAIDITNRKQAEIALQASERRYRLAVQSGQVGVWDWNIITNEVHVDAQLKTMLGYADHELPNDINAWQSLIYPDDLEQITARMNDYLEGRVPDYVVEHRMRHRDGGIRWFLTRGVALWDETGTPYRMTGTRTDITDRKQLELAFQQSEHHLNAILSNASAAIASFRLTPNQTPVFDFLSAASERIFGYTPAEIMTDSQVWLSGILPEDRDNVILPAMSRVMNGQRVTVEYRFQHKTDTLRWISETLAPDWNNADNCWQVTSVAIDITDRKQAELAIYQAIEREQQTREREQFIATIAHNIRQSLDLSQILNTTVEEVRRFVDVDRVVIFRFNLDGSGRIVAESLSDPAYSILNQVIYDPCFTETMLHPYRQGGIQTVNDIEAADLPSCYVEQLTRLQVRAALTLPILVQHELWGLLIAHQCSGPYQWQQVSWYLLRQLSTQLAIGIYQAELYQQVQHLNTNLENEVRERTTELQQTLEFEALLKRITDNVRDSLDEEQILQTVVQELTQGLAIPGCDVALYNFERQIIEIRFESRLEAMPPLQTRTIPMGGDNEDLLNQLLQGNIFQFGRISSLTTRQVERQFMVFSCPITDNQRVIGSLWLYRRCQESFSPLEIRLVQQVANQCAIAIRQARLYRDAQAQVVELERLNRLKDDFLSSVSHELRTPVASIKMAAQMLEILLLRSGSGPSSNATDLAQSPLSPAAYQRVQQYLQILNNECQREIDLITNLLDLTRLDAQADPLLTTTIDLRVWIPHVVEPFIEIIQSHQQQLRLELSSDLPSITTDLSYLQRILSELLTNANKYTPAGGTITIAVATSEPEPNSIQIRVINTGIEIPPLEIPRIFEKFYRIPNNDPWRHGGTGLGLALVQKIATKLGATIAVESENDQVTFTLFLPLQISV